MELRVLRYFLAVARERGLTGASSILHVTQPTLSRQIRELEEELGHELFVRGGRNMELTSEGMFLRKRAEEILSMVEKTEAAFDCMESAVSGDIYIGGGETRALYRLACAAKELQMLHPGLRYHLHSGNSQDVTERLDKGLLDFGILIQPADLSKYESLDLPEKDVWGVVMRKDSPLAEQKTVCKEDLLPLPLIFSQQVMFKHPHNEYVRWFGEDYDKLNVVTTFNLMYNAALMVEVGIGYAVTIGGLINTSAESPLCFRPLEPRLEAGLSIVWKKYQVFSKAAGLFLDKLHETFKYD